MDNENIFVNKVCSKNKRRNAHKQGGGDWIRNWKR